MIVKTSKEVTDRQKACVFLLSVFLLQGPKVAETLSELFRPHLPEGEAPGFLSVIMTLARALKAAMAELVAADEAHYAAKAAYTATLRRRDALAGWLTTRMVGLRRTVLGQHEDPDLGRLGFEGETGREAVIVMRQVDRVVDIFDGTSLREGESLESILGPPLFDDSPFETRNYGEQLKRRADELHLVVDQIGDERRRAEDAFLKVQSKAKSYDQLFLRGARIFEDKCRLIGWDELADRIRPSTKKPGQTEQEPPPEEEANAEALAAGPPAAGTPAAGEPTAGQASQVEAAGG